MNVSSAGLVLAGFYSFCATYALIDAYGSCAGPNNGNGCADMALYLSAPGQFIVDILVRLFGLSFPFFWTRLVLGSVLTAILLYLVGAYIQSALKRQTI